MGLFPTYLIHPSSGHLVRNFSPSAPRPASPHPIPTLTTSSPPPHLSTRGHRSVPCLGASSPHFRPDQCSVAALNCKVTGALGDQGVGRGGADFAMASFRRRFHMEGKPCRWWAGWPVGTWGCGWPWKAPGSTQDRRRGGRTACPGRDPADQCRSGVSINRLP